MKMLLIISSVVLILGILILLTAYVCYRVVFFASRKIEIPTEEYPIPPGKIYEPFRDTMVQWMKETREFPFEEVSVTSFDGLKLCGKYYEYAPGAPLEIMFHGYRGSAERDLCGGVQRCHAIGRNALIVDQRTSCKSEGTVISFGVNESRDCQTWIDFAIKRFGDDVKIVLCGISMGAATVLMAAGRTLPKNVVGVLADCGFSSAREIIIKCANEIHCPGKFLYPFIKLGAKLYGRFDLDEYSPKEAMKTCQVPVIFIHGDTDVFVPCEMSQINYDACVAPKRFVKVPKAGHGLSYLVDSEGYLKVLAEFFTEHGLPTKVVEPR